MLICVSCAVIFFRVSQPAYLYIYISLQVLKLYQWHPDQDCHAMLSMVSPGLQGWEIKQRRPIEPGGFMEIGRHIMNICVKCLCWSTRDPNCSMQGKEQNLLVLFSNVRFLFIFRKVKIFCYPLSRPQELRSSIRFCLSLRYCNFQRWGLHFFYCLERVLCVARWELGVRMPSESQASLGEWAKALTAKPLFVTLSPLQHIQVHNGNFPWTRRAISLLCSNQAGVVVSQSDHRLRSCISIPIVPVCSGASPSATPIPTTAVGHHTVSRSKSSIDPWLAVVGRTHKRRIESNYT